MGSSYFGNLPKVAAEPGCGARFGLEPRRGKGFALEGICQDNPSQDVAVTRWGFYLWID